LKVSCKSSMIEMVPGELVSDELIVSKAFFTYYRKVARITLRRVLPIDRFLCFSNQSFLSRGLCACCVPLPMICTTD